MARKAATYNEDSIEVLEGLAGVRRKPGMYLGELGAPMVFRMVKEIADNAADEFAAGRNSLIHVAVDPRNDDYIVADAGGGIPVGIKKPHNVSALTLIFTKLHAGGKFNNKAYATAAGTHGVGSSAVNAVSSSFEVWTHRDGKWHYQGFKCGEPVAALKSGVKVPADVLSKLGVRALKCGTVVRFKPDQSIVSDGDKKAKLDVKAAYEWLRGVANLNTNLTIKFVYNGKTRTLVNKVGPRALLDKQLEELQSDPLGKPILYEDTQMSLAIQWSSYTDLDGLRSYVSCSPTKEHGTHVRGLLDALTKAIQKHAKVGKTTYKPADLTFGLLGVFNWRMSEPAFNSQVKDKLVSNVTKEVTDKAFPIFDAFFSKNSALAGKIVKRAADLKKIKDQQKKMLDGVAQVRDKARGVMLPGVLAQATGCSADERELYVVEGDSAAGLAKLARDEKFQEVMRAKGKPTNCLRSDLAKCLANTEVQNLLIATGVDPKTFKASTFDTNSLRIRSINLLADADVDGGHINCLLLAFIVRFMPKLLDEGRVFIIDAPLFSTQYNGKRFYGQTHADVVRQLPKGAKPQIMRSKGWGEIQLEVLRDVAFDTATRRRMCVRPPSKKDIEAFGDIMGTDSTARKKLLGVA